MYILRWGYQPFQSIEVCWSLYSIYGEWFKPATTLRFNFYASFEHFESALPSLCQASCWSGKTSKKASSHHKTARVRQRKVRWSFPWQSLLLRSPDRLQWSACLNDQLICTEGQPTTIWQSSSIFFVPMFLSHLIRLRMRQSFISLLSHQRWIFFSNLYAAQPAYLLSFAAFVAKRRENRGRLPSKFPPLKLAFGSK